MNVNSEGIWQFDQFVTNVERNLGNLARYY